MIQRWRGGCEKRRARRLCQCFPVTVLEAEVSAEGKTASSGHTSYWANAIARKASGINIARGGLAFEVNKPYRVGTILAFEVVLPEPQEYLLPLIRRLVQRQVKHFRALCQVVWVGVLSAGSYRMGVRFIDTNDQRSAALDQLTAEYQWQERFLSPMEGQANRFSDDDDEPPDLEF